MALAQKDKEVRITAYSVWCAAMINFYVSICINLRPSVCHTHTHTHTHTCTHTYTHTHTHTLTHARIHTHTHTHTHTLAHVHTHTHTLAHTHTYTRSPPLPPPHTHTHSWKRCADRWPCSRHSCVVLSLLATQYEPRSTH